MLTKFVQGEKWPDITPRVQQIHSIPPQRQGQAELLIGEPDRPADGPHSAEDPSEVGGRCDL